MALSVRCRDMTHGAAGKESKQQNDKTVEILRGRKSSKLFQADYTEKAIVVIERSSYGHEARHQARRRHEEEGSWRRGKFVVTSALGN